MKNRTIEMVYNGEVSLDENLAKRAKEANSYSDYVAGSATKMIQDIISDAVAIAQAQKRATDETHHEKIDALLLRYACKMIDNLNDANRIDASVPSIMITGGGNFPVRKKEKQNQARDKNMREREEIQCYLDKIKGVGKGGISADDPDAMKKLEKKLENLEKLHESMKVINAYYRKHKTLDGCPQLTSEQTEGLKNEMASAWHISKKPFELSNNNAEIKRIKDRIKTIKKRDENVFNSYSFDGGKIDVNKNTNRLCIYFDDKPNEDLRQKLKSHGFRWAPSVGAWQRQYTNNAVFALRYFEELKPA